MAASGLETILWTDAPRAGLCRQVLDLMGAAVCPLGVAGPRGEPATLAAALGCPFEDDLRKLLIDRPAAYALLAATPARGAEDLALVQASNATVLLLEPPAADFDELAALARGPNHQAPAAPLTLAPAFLRQPGWLAAADPVQALGALRCLALTSMGPPAGMSLPARLLDAWLTLLELTDLPQAIDASLVGGDSRAAADLRRATGYLAAHARLPDGAQALLVLSDRAALEDRQLLAVGEAGQLRVADAGYTLHAANGRLLDQSPAPPAPAGYADQIARHWRLLIDRPAMSGLDLVGSPGRRALACCLACLLSARTGQPESPGELLRMHGVA